MFRNTFNNTTNCQNTTNSYNTTTNNNVWNNCSTVGQPEILTWLSLLDPGLRHCDIQERRANDVGEWLMGTDQFRRWCGLGVGSEGDNAVMFCYGNPGVGKTFISSLVVDKLCDQTRGKQTAVTCFYFDFAARKGQTATSMLGSILKQMISGTERVPKGIWQALQEQKKAVSGRKPQLGDIVKILQLITSSQRTFMVIDALDECTAVQRFRLFDSLREILEKSPGARIFVTGRPHIRAEIEIRLVGRMTCVSVCPASEDIIRFLRVRLSEDETPDAMDSRLEAEILEKIPGSISDMFLLASLNIEAILQGPKIYRRREILGKITDGLGLGDVYGATIEWIKGQGVYKSRLGMEALMWISYAERPLCPDELCHALAIELGSTDFNADNIPSIATLMGCCQGLIIVDREASRVRLAHYTLKEYFSAHTDILSKPHSAIAEICLTYLNSQQVKATPADRHLNLPHTCFLKYCSLYWGVHARREPSDRSRSLALHLFQEYDGHISTPLLLNADWLRRVEHYDSLPRRGGYRDGWGQGFEYPRSWSRFRGLHCASYLGIVEIVVALIGIRCGSPNGKDFWERTPLSWATQKGQEEVVKILLKWRASPDSSDSGGRTPLSYAAWEGHEGMVKILLGQEEVEPNKPDSIGRTPLPYAVERGHEGVVKILLEREEVNSNKADNRGRTPLSFAAACGEGGVVQLLLEREGVNPDPPDSLGETPLWHASWNGHEGVVKMLLARLEFNLDRLDCDDQTPLSRTVLFFLGDARHAQGVQTYALNQCLRREESGNL